MSTSKNYSKFQTCLKLTDNADFLTTLQVGTMNNIENAANVSTANNQGLFILSVSV